MKKIQLLLTLTAIIAALSVNGQNYFGGSDIFRIGYTDSRTISNATDVITLGLVSVDLTKTASLFREDAQAGVLVRATLSGYDKPTRTNQSTTIERLYLVDVTKYPTGQVSLPIEGTLFDNFPLTFDKNIYTKVELEIILLKKRKDTDFGFVLKNVAKLTQNLPFPTNPFDPIVKSLAGSINDMLSPENDAENNIRERIPTGKISLNFLPSSPFATKTGIFAVIFGTEPPFQSGYVDIKKPNDYIFSILTEPKRAIVVAPKNNPSQTSELRNDNLMFFIEAFSSNVDKQQTVTTSFSKGDSTLTLTSTEIQNKVLDADWSSKTSSTFNATFQTALKEYNKSGNGIPFIKATDLTKEQISIGSNELLMIDYIQALEQRKQLGIDDKKITLPKPSIYLLKE